MGIRIEEQVDLINTVCEMVDDERYDELVPTYLQAAEEAVLRRRYPHDDTKTWEDTNGRYDMKAAEIAVYMINKRGAEGEVQHWENGTKRAYESASVPPSMLKDIVPFVGVPR